MSGCAEAARQRSCSSRSSKDGSAATPSSAAARGSFPSRRPSASRHPWSATSPTTTPRRWSRRCRFPPQARTCRRVASSSPTRSCASTTPAGWRRCSGATPRRCAICSTGRRRPLTPGRGAGGETTRSPARADYERNGGGGEGAHRRGRHLPGRPLPAGRAPDTGRRAPALPDAAARESLAVPVPARARRPRPDRLVPGDAGQARGDAGEPEPDRGHDGARAGRRRAAAGVGEGPRRARDARRPRPQRPLARLPGGQRARPAVHGGRALLARHPPRLRGGRRAPRRGSGRSTCCAPAFRRERSPAHRRCARCS